MKNVFIAVILASALHAGQAVAQSGHGSNADGGEKVCALGMGAQSEQGLDEALKRCKRGDILDIGWVKISVAMQLCDFTKTIVYHPPTGAIAACVYSGSRRPIIK
jgi:hypothetical protein